MTRESVRATGQCLMAVTTCTVLKIIDSIRIAAMTEEMSP